MYPRWSLPEPDIWFRVGRGYVRTVGSDGGMVRVKCGGLIGWGEGGWLGGF